MKRKAFILITLFLTIQIFVVYASRDYTIEKVTITGLESPYTSKGNLDTDVEVSQDSRSVVNRVAWTKNDAGEYVAQITVRPGVYASYTEATTATVNGNAATSVRINDKRYLEITYVYPEDKDADIIYNQSTLTHVITVYYTENGSITPKRIRAPHGKNFTVKITPDAGYEIKDVIVDGESVGAVEEYTFKKVKETHRIRATFKPIEGYEFEEEPIEVNKENVKWAADFLREVLAAFASLKR